MLSRNWTYFDEMTIFPEILCFFCLLSEEEVKAWKEWKKIALKVPQSVEPSHYFRGKVNAGTCQQWKVFFALLLLKIKTRLSFV